MYYKRAGRIAASLCFFILLSGCSGGTPPKESRSDSHTVSAASSIPRNAGQKDTVVISAVDGIYTSGLRQLAADYTKLHPETTVTVDVVSPGLYLKKLETSLATDLVTAPDIIQGAFDAENPAETAVNRQTADLSGFLDLPNRYNGGKKIRDSFRSDTIGQVASESGGTIRFLPFDRSGYGFYYNKSIFKKWNITQPDSIEALLEDCRKLQAAGFSVPVSTSPDAITLAGMFADSAYRPLLAQFGSPSGNSGVQDAPDPRKILSYLKANGVNTAENEEIWNAFYSFALFFPPDWAVRTAPQALSAFESQASPLLFGSGVYGPKLLADFNRLSPDKRFEWGIFTLPEYNDPPKGLEAAVRGYTDFYTRISAVKKPSELHQSRVYDVLSLWFSPKEAQKIYQASLSGGDYIGGVPVMNGVSVSKENAASMNSFLTESGMRPELMVLAGLGAFPSADSRDYFGLFDRFIKGTLDTGGFLAQLDPMARAYAEETLKGLPE